MRVVRHDPFGSLDKGGMSTIHGALVTCEYERWVNGGDVEDDTRCRGGCATGAIYSTPRLSSAAINEPELFPDKKGIRWLYVPNISTVECLKNAGG